MISCWFQGEGARKCFLWFRGKKSRQPGKTRLQGREGCFLRDPGPFWKVGFGLSREHSPSAAARGGASNLPLSFLALGAAPPLPPQEERAAQPQGSGGLGRSLGALLLLLGTRPAPQRLALGAVTLHGPEPCCCPQWGSNRPPRRACLHSEQTVPSL